ncbi:Flp pilus assembly protein CpaB [Vibrio breoganii]
MSKGQIAFLLILSIAFGLGAVFVAKQWIDKKAQPEIKVEKVERHPIVIANVDIPEGTVIEAKQLMLKQLEVDWLDETQVKSVDDIVGKVAVNNIYKNEIININRTAGPNEGTTLATLLPEDMRAVTIRVNDVVGVAGFLLPGSKVDILNTVNSRTSTVLKNIKVLAVDQTARTPDNKPIIVRAVTLQVSPREAERLLSENSKGSIQLALRNPLAIDKPDVKRRYTPPPSVTILKGTQQSSVRVNE